MEKLHNSLDFHKRTLLTGGLILVFIWSLFSIKWGPDLLHPGGGTILLQIIKALFHPNFSSEIMSFVGLGGLGYQIQLALQDLNYNDVWTYLFFLVALVVVIDFWSNILRRWLVE